MKIPQEKLKAFIEQAADMCLYMKDNVVWEGQEGQPDHFDRLPKAEQVALIALYSRMSDLESELLKYQHWFEQS